MNQAGLFIIGSIIDTDEKKQKFHSWYEVRNFLYWTQGVFLLLDVCVLFFALLGMNRVIKGE